MDEGDIQVLIDGTVHYFHRSLDRTAEVGTPYLLEDRQRIISDYTGVIGITGVRRGCVYFTAPSAMLRHILMTHGETRVDSEFMADVVGEVANTISGNARRVFGEEFVISVPTVYSGTPDFSKMSLAERSFVIPIHWRQYHAALVVSIS
ncbi:MAG: chemotaxis protein CheX [Xanthomonadales bacterium]|nr:chemotaxis protein CheX [Xanthomonadales bacterium]MCB1633033.1 chemotaxis protein CheX [Xanthomonadales bacterium]MCB1640295.1 chemotaxis protein CheX [Xanthomonadales bacterium]